MERTSFDPAKEKYSVAQRPLAEDPHHVAVLRSTHAFAATGAKTLAPPKGPHFMDFEGNLAQQRGAADAFLAAKTNFPPPSAEPWAVERVVGFRPAPWKDRPLG
jgi:hypothetical protein